MALRPYRNASRADTGLADRVLQRWPTLKQSDPDFTFRYNELDEEETIVHVEPRAFDQAEARRLAELGPR